MGSSFCWIFIYLCWQITKPDNQPSQSTAAHPLIKRHRLVSMRKGRVCWSPLMMMKHRRGFNNNAQLRMFLLAAAYYVNLCSLFHVTTHHIIWSHIPPVWQPHVLLNVCYEIKQRVKTTVDEELQIAAVTRSVSLFEGSSSKCSS